MPRQRSRKVLKEAKNVNKPVSRDSSAEEENASDVESMGVSDKDEEERELDRLVLGDGAGFRAGLDADMDWEDGVAVEEDGEAKDDGVEAGSGLEDVDDADLFFLDAGPSTVDSNALVPFANSENALGHDVPAWEDSDDDRLIISLAGNPRLRKLRVNATEDLVSGREYTRRLRRQFERLNPVPEWAQPSSRPAKRRRRSSAGSDSSISSDDMDADDTELSTLPLARLLQDASSLMPKPTERTMKRAKLRPEVLDIQRTRDISLVQPSAITSLSFHPTYPILLSSGPASTLYLHHISSAAHPEPNPLITSVHIRNTPLTTSAFLHPAGDKIFFSGRRRYFHTWDLPTGTIQKVTRVYGQKDEQKSMERFKLSPCGRYMGLIGSGMKAGGVINILDATTTQWIASARIEGKNGVADFSWWRDGEGLTIVGKGGDVGEWSMSTRSFIARWIDDGSIGATVMTLGGHNGPKELGGDRWVVIGSQSGIVNIYDRRTFITTTNPTNPTNPTISIPERPEPKKTFSQLTTPTSNLEISPDGQILVFSSKWKKNALRLVHLPSCTVYRNWPTGQTPFGRITSVAFGKGSDLLAVGNEAGKLRLWEIRS